MRMGKTMYESAEEGIMFVAAAAATAAAATTAIKEGLCVSSVMVLCVFMVIEDSHEFTFIWVRFAVHKPANTFCIHTHTRKYGMKVFGLENNNNNHSRKKWPVMKE